MAVEIPADVLAGLEEVRREGRYNMFAYHDVMRRAYEREMYAVVAWMSTHKGDYARGIFEGFEAQEEPERRS